MKVRVSVRVRVPRGTASSCVRSMVAIRNEVTTTRGKAALWSRVRVRVRVRVGHHDTQVRLLRTTYDCLSYLVEGVGGMADHMQLRRRKPQPLLHLVSI